MIRGVTYAGSARVETVRTTARAPGDGEVQIRVAYCGLCGTDLHIFHGHMDGRVAPGLIFGHEMAGTIEAVGPGVSDWAAGDRVTVMPLQWDGTCAACHAGHQHICQNLTFIGIDAPGALQELWTVPASVLVGLPADLDLRTAALVEPTAVAVHDVRRSGLQPGDRVVVMGGGPIGVLIACVARLGGGRVMIAEVDRRRRELAEALGFATIDPSSADIVDAVASWTAGVGADVVFEVSGAAAAVASTTAIAKVRGTIVVVAIHSSPREVDLQQIFWKELRILGARVYQRSDFERAAELLADDAIPASELITDAIPLERTESALSALADGTGMKVLVDVGGVGR